MSDGWGWAGSVQDYLSTPPEVILRGLQDHHQRLLGYRAAGTQLDAWEAEEAAARHALRTCVAAAATTPTRWPPVFGSDLPPEGGGGPEVVVLPGAAVGVVEFRSARLP